MDNEFIPFKRAVQAANTYDDLSDDIKVIFDRAEAEAIRAREEYERAIQADGGGYGRFHGTAI